MKIIIGYTVPMEKEIEVSDEYAFLRNDPLMGDGKELPGWDEKANELEAEIKKVIPADAELEAVRDAKDRKLLFEM